jgi:hypothetical protein
MKAEFVYDEAMERQIARIGTDTLDDRHLTLQPLHDDPIDDLCGFFGPGPSLEDDLKDWRSAEKW